MATPGPTGSEVAIAPGALNRKVFVAYSYRLYPDEAFRQTFKTVGTAFQIEFVYADERITNEHILDKISRMIQEARFSIFDISDWNPNVTLELGIARGSGRRWFIAIDPSKATGEIPEAPADLRGFDRIQYSTFSELQRGLTRLFAQEFPPESSADPLAPLRTRIVSALESSPGMSATDISTAVGVTLPLTQLLLRQMRDDGQIEARGQTRATKYYPVSR